MLFYIRLLYFYTYIYMYEYTKLNLMLCHDLLLVIPYTRILYYAV